MREISGGFEARIVNSDAFAKAIALVGCPPSFTLAWRSSRTIKPLADLIKRMCPIPPYLPEMGGQ